MTLALSGYSAVFMRYSMAVTPKNYLLFACHTVNLSAQLTQGYRYLTYWKCVPPSLPSFPDSFWADWHDGAVGRCKSGAVGLAEVGPACCVR